MTEDDKEFIAREIQILREEVSAFIGRQQEHAQIRHRWLKHLIRDLETNPKTQYKVHLWGAIYWLINFPLVTLLFFLDQKHWLVYGVYITLMYSIYANFATDYGAMSSALAIRREVPLPDIPMAYVEGNGGLECPGGESS